MWQPPPLRPTLPSGTIHVWRFGLGAALSVDWLSADEHERAARLRFELARQRFIATRTHLRMILSRYLDTDPAKLRFTTNAHGKPALQNGDLHFNLSHTDDLALLAVAAQAVGVDVERVRPVSNPDYIMGSAFTERERAVIQALTGEAALHAFWRCWTRKEAVMKLLGIGFRLAQQFSVSIDEPPVVLESEALQAFASAPPALHNISQPKPDHVAALASSDLANDSQLVLFNLI